MIIGLSGKIGTGKDLTGKIIQILTSFPNMTTERVIAHINKDLANNVFEIRKFADKLKDIVCILIGCTREQLEDADFKNKELGEEWKVSLNDIEIWKPIPTYEGYLINNFGQIKSLDRKGSDGRFIKGVYKEYHLGTTGYPSCTLSNNEGKKTWAIHQLIMWSFTNYVPSYYDCVINHIDNIKTNNCITNLEIVSSRYNSTIHKKSKSGEHGIYERNGEFEVTLRIDGKKSYLGKYETIDKAISVRNNKLLEIDAFKRIYLDTTIYTPRLLLQRIGTESMRNIIHPNIWVNALMSEYKPREATLISKDCPRQDIYSLTEEDEIIYGTIGKLYPNWIITDMRFPNELKAVKDRGGISIRIERFKQISENIRVHGVGVPHESETALDNATFDYVIDNNGTIEELVVKVKEILIKENII